MELKKSFYDCTSWYNDVEQLHREDGPAIEYADGSKSWWINGKHHREDGPAIEREDGYKAWYINGKRMSEEEHRKQMQKDQSCSGKVVEIDGKQYKLMEV